MSLSLKKGGTLNVTKTSGGKDYFVIGMGWDDSGPDLDTFAILGTQQPDGTVKVLGDASFIYFNQLTSAIAGVRHMGDDLTGGADGDAEQIHVDIKTLDKRVDRIDFFCTVFEAGKRHQTFHDATNAYARVGYAQRDSSGNPVLENAKMAAITEIGKLDLTDDYSGNWAVQVGALYLDHDTGEWTWTSMGQGLGHVEIGDIFEKYMPGVTAHA